MEISLAGAFFSPLQAVQVWPCVASCEMCGFQPLWPGQVLDLHRLKPSCIAKCFPQNVHRQQLHGQNETDATFSCVKMCKPYAEACLRWLPLCAHMIASITELYVCCSHHRNGTAAPVSAR